MFEDNFKEPLIDQIIKHYRDVLGVDNFNAPEDKVRLARQVKFDMLERKKEDLPWNT